MPAKSKAQRRFFGLVKAYQTGKLKDHEVSDHVKNAAKHMSGEEVDKYASTPETNLPEDATGDTNNMVLTTEPSSSQKTDYEDLVDEDLHSTLAAGINPFTKTQMKNLQGMARKKNDDLNKADKEKNTNSSASNATENVTPSYNNLVSEYKSFGRFLQRESDLRHIGEKLSKLAESAENSIMTEAEDWHDSYTIKRNMKEMKSYASDFAKYAIEADRLHERMSALYEDMGRVLERYSQMNNQKTIKEGVEIASVKSEPRLTVINRIIKESVPERIDGTLVDSYTANAMKMVYESLQGEEKKKFCEIPIKTAIGATWRLITK